jgi:putative flippase GtrA
MSERTDTGARHWAGFFVSGLVAFSTDVAISKALFGYAGVPLWLARAFGVGLSMVAGWLCHRRLTFAVAASPSLAEFLRYAGMAWAAAALNYGVFLVIMWARPALEPAIAIFLASVVAMAASYLGMRFAVFRR